MPRAPEPDRVNQLAGKISGECRHPSSKTDGGARYIRGQLIECRIAFASQQLTYPTMRSPTTQPATQRKRLSFSHPSRNGLFTSTTPLAVALPPGHFLSLPATHASPQPHTAISAPAAHADTYTSAQTVTPHLGATNLAPNVSTTASADFEVDVRTGFLPFDAAIERLPARYAVWEEALWAARGEGVVGQCLRLGVDGIKEQVWRKGVEEVSNLPARERHILTWRNIDAHPLPRFAA